MILASIGIIASTAGGYDANAQAFFTAAGITDTTQKDAVNTMVLSLKSNSLWSKFLAIYPFVGGTSTTHKYNLKSRNYDFPSFGGTWTHNSSGATPSPNAYADSGINPLTDILLIPRSDTSVWYYGTGNYGNTGPQIAIGLNDFTLLNPYSSDSNLQSRLNSTMSSAKTHFSGYQKGLFGISRLNDSNFKHYTIPLDTTSTYYRQFNDAVQVPVNLNIYVGAANVNSTAQYGTQYTCGLAMIGNGLTDSEAVILNTITTTYQTALGRN